MRHFRNLIYFVLGVFIALAFSAPAFAGMVKTQPKSWYGGNTGGVTKGFSGSTPPGTWSSNDGVWNPPTFKSNGSFKKNGLDIPFSANQDFYPKDLYPGLKKGLSSGFKGLAKGGLGLGPLLGGLALGWAIEQGYNWMDELKCQAQLSCWAKDKYADAPYSANYDVTVSAIMYLSGGYSYTYNPWRSMGLFSNTSACNFSDSASIQVPCSTSQLAQIDQWCKSIGFVSGSGVQCVRPNGQKDTAFRAYRVGSATASQPRPVTAVPDAEIQPQLEQAATANFGPWFQAAVDDDMILEIEQDRPLTLDPAPPVVAPATVTTSTQTNADGTTQLTTETTAETYTVRCIPFGVMGCDNLAPYNFTTGTTTTTQTTSCAQGGTCVTDVKTSETTTPRPEQTPKQEFCAANPKALECLDVGEIPNEEIPTQTKNLNFTWTPFSVSATCPAPYSMTIKGKTYLYQWTYYCDFATKTKPFILILAFIGAYFIIMGARKE